MSTTRLLGDFEVNEPTNDLPHAAEPVAPELPDENEVEREGFSLGRALRSPRTLISFALAIAIVLFVVKGINIDVGKTWAYMRGANPWLLLTGLLVFI